MAELTKSKILIVLFGAIGDVTRALPLATRIKRHLPDCELGWAVEPLSCPLVNSHPAVDRVYVFDRPRGFSAYIAFIKEVRAAGYHIVLDMQRHFKSGVTTYLTGAPRRIGFHRSNAKEFNWLFSNEYIDRAPEFSSKLAHYQKFGDRLQLPPLDGADSAFLLPRNADLSMDSLLDRAVGDRVRSRSVTSKRIGLLLGGSWESKSWETAYYVRIIEELAARAEALPFLFGGPTDRGVADDILRATDLPVVDLVGRISLEQLPAAFSRMEMVIAPDTGPMHIASLSGVPVIGLFGPTSPERSAPYGSEHLVINGQTACSPCYRRRCPGLGKLCMKSITPEIVLEQISRVFSDVKANAPNV